jgi:hypothetical protein
MAHHDCHRSHDWCASCGDATSGRSARGAAAQQSIEGKITEVVYLPGSTRDTAMVELRLATSSQGDVIVRLAPVNVLRQLQVDLREGETVRVNGYWVDTSGGDRLISTQIVAQGRTVQLRDTGGHCRW